MSGGNCPRGNKCPLSHRKLPSVEAPKKSKKNLNDNEKNKKFRTCKMGVLGLATGDEKGYKPHLGVRGSTVGNRYFDDCVDTEDACESNEINTRASTSSTLDVKRKRILDKLEKIKRNYNVGTDNVEDSLDSETEQNSLITKASNVTTSETLNSRSTFRFASLPEVLPSFIPLEMPECS